MEKGNFWLSYKIRGQIVELLVQCICFDAVSRWLLKRYGCHVINGHQTLNILGISCLWTEQTNPCIKTLKLLCKIQHCPHNISFDFYMAIYSKTSFNGIILTSSGIKSLVQEFTIPFMKNESLQSLPAEFVEYSHNLTCILSS